MKIIWCMFPEIWNATDRVTLDHFSPFYSTSNPKKNQNFGKMEKHLNISSFYTRLPKIMLICFTVPEIWRMTDVIFIFNFRLLFALMDIRLNNSVPNWAQIVLSLEKRISWENWIILLFLSFGPQYATMFQNQS